MDCVDESLARGFGPMIADLCSCVRELLHAVPCGVLVDMEKGRPRGGWRQGVEKVEVELDEVLAFAREHCLRASPRIVLAEHLTL